MNIQIGQRAEPGVHGLCLGLFFTMSLFLAAAAPAPAQAAAALSETDAPLTEANAYYRWIDRQGRVQYTDFEPVGIPSQLVELDPDAAAAVASAPVLQGADHEWQPDPFHDQDQQILPIEHIGPCADARQQLAVLYTDLPVYRGENGAYRSAWRGDSYRGSRTYLEDEEREQAISKARSTVLNNCSDPKAFENEVNAFKEQMKAR